MSINDLEYNLCELSKNFVRVCRYEVIIQRISYIPRGNMFYGYWLFTRFTYQTNFDRMNLLFVWLGERDLLSLDQFQHGIEKQW